MPIRQLIGVRVLSTGCSVAAFVSLVTLAQAAWAADDDGFEFFEKRIRPVLIRHCYECHSSASTELKAQLRLDSRDGIRTGGETGPAVVPGNVGESV